LNGLNSIYEDLKTKRVGAKSIFSFSSQALHDGKLGQVEFTNERLE
jgi:hypothetical protein